MRRDEMPLVSQVGNISRLDATAVLSDGSIVVGGSETFGETGDDDEDFVAFRLNHTDGSLIWKWKVSG